MAREINDLELHWLSLTLQYKHASARDLRNCLYELHRNGVSATSIAKVLHVSRATVHRMLNEAEDDRYL